MNKRGFTLVELLATIVIVGLIMAIVLPSATRIGQENKQTIYETYEKMTEEYAAISDYKNNYYIELSDLEELDKVKKECVGYVLIDHETEVLQYKAYLQCGDQYKTEGYVDSYNATKTKIDIPTCVQNVEYDGTMQNLVNINGPYTLTNEKRKNVGSQNVTATLSNKRMYAWSDDSQDDKIIRNCTMHQREIKVIADNKEMMYGDSPPTFTYHLEHTVAGENPLTTNVSYTIKNGNTTITPNSSTPIGTYSIIPNTSVSDNYYKTTVNGTLTVKRSLFIVTLNNNGATTAGTGKIYERYGKNWYKNSDGTTAITAITIPVKNGYLFKGYYTGENGTGTLAIDSSGLILLANSAYNTDVTLYAKWEECGNGHWCTNNVRSTCPAGTYGNGTKTASSQSGACKECGNGAWCDGTNGTHRETCPAGYYGNGTTTGSSKSASCKICDKGYYCTGFDNKTACGDGKYNNLEGQSSPTACKNIDAGCYGTSGTSSCPNSCGAGKYSLAGSSSCSDIKAGCYGTNGTKECPNSCGAGKWSSKGSSSCSNIKAGCYGTSASNNCPNKCSSGTYSKEGASSCTNCGGGKYSGEAASSCSNIKAGCYGTNASNDCPKKCSSGTYSNAGASSCTNCGGGKYSGEGASSCSNIKAGCYGTNASNDCPNSCGAGKYSLAGSSSCSNISAGCYGTKGTKACPNECPAGTYSNQGASSCTNCNSGKYSTGTKNTSCKTCPTNYYSATSGAQTSCYDNVAPTANGWRSVSQTSTVISSGTATTKLCNLGSDAGDGLKKIYYRTSCTSSWSNANISGGCASISFSKCSSGTLYYYLYDGRNSSGTVSVSNIPKWLLIGQAYTQLIRVNVGVANTEMGYHYDLNKAASRNVYDIATSAEANLLSDSTFVMRMYNAVLARNYDTGGYNSWMKALSASGRASVANGFVTSAEAGLIYSAWGQS